MNNFKFPAVVIIGLAFVIVGLSAFTVNERQLAIKLRVGEVVSAQYEPGLHFKIPVIETVRKFPSRILKIDDAPQRVFTLERTAMTVDYFVKWQIVDELSFYTSTGGIQDVAMNRLREIIKNSIVTEFGKRTIVEAISVEREELMRDMLANAMGTAQGLGVQLVDFRVKQVEFVSDVRNSVYNQMREERKRVAAETRAEGSEAADLIRSTADKDRTVILAEANRDGQIIRGEGDARAAEIYANAYTRDPEFYAFYRSIDAYRNSIGKEGDVLVLDPNNEFFRYLNQSDGKQQ
ncbi:MAG: protease modulator HflC [Gammaproteobacteria bacterium]|jgi:membrane protease subunit HflC|nr:protease modulator HflC [Gammaproteobacteria bacterium]MDH3778616.1 protease modulator HflC [Gammaproteobacteria bacterium]MDH3810950.1 protease modulator HflC [Gammaproteobacteria bacterium]